MSRRTSPASTLPALSLTRSTSDARLVVLYTAFATQVNTNLNKKHFFCDSCQFHTRASECAQKGNWITENTSAACALRAVCWIFFLALSPGCPTPTVAQTLHRLLEWKNHGSKWPARNYLVKDLLNTVLVRINEAAGPYQMFGQLADVYLLHRYFPFYKIVILFLFILLKGLKLDLSFYKFFGLL